MKSSLFIGVDISKATLDVSILASSNINLVHYHQFANHRKAFASPRKFACYSGCAPFSYQSGISIQGKNRVHFIANKKMKSLLHMAAMSAITHDEELKQYYQRKIKEGKSPMSVLNAVRFKLICRVFSVVRRSETFRKDYPKVAA